MRIFGLLVKHAGRISVVAAVIAMISLANAAQGQEQNSRPGAPAEQPQQGQPRPHVQPAPERAEPSAPPERAPQKRAPKAPSLNESKGGNGRTTPSSSAGYEPSPPLPRRGSGTGFFINATDMVTNAHVVEECDAIRDSDGRRLEVVRLDRQLDLALLRADRKSSTWLTIAPAEERLRLGSGVIVLGFPFYGDLGNSVIVTRGVVSSRTGFQGRRANFGIDALLRPGNSGGPVLDRKGRVIGVAFSVFPTPGYSAETTPQNVNFAISAPALTDFLQDAGATFIASPEMVANMGDGVPEDLENSVKPVLCD